MVMGSRSVGGVTVAAVADTAAPSSFRVINRPLQILHLDLVIFLFRSTFVLKIFAQDLNRYALINAAVFETISREIDRLSSFSRRRNSLNDEFYALRVRSNLAVIQKLISKICVIYDVRRGGILMI